MARTSATNGSQRSPRWLRAAHSTSRSAACHWAVVNRRLACGLAVDLALQPQQHRGMPDSHLGLAVQDALVAAPERQASQVGCAGYGEPSLGAGRRGATLPTPESSAREEARGEHAERRALARQAARRREVVTMLQRRCGYLSRCRTRRCNSRTAPSNSSYTGWTRGSPSLASSVIGTVMSRCDARPGGRCAR